MRNVRRGAEMFDNPEDLSLVDQCILGFNAGTADGFRHLQQQPADRAIARLRRHLQRDGAQRPHRPDRRPSAHGTAPMWTGDSRGRWEGDTLVVETLNFSARPAAFKVRRPRPRSWNASRALTRKPSTIGHTSIGPRRRTHAMDRVDAAARDRRELYDDACHEGNYGMMDVLRGARYREKEGK